MPRVHLALIAVTLIYGFFYIFIKQLLVEATPMMLFAWRIFAAAVVTGLVELALVRTRFASVKDWLKTCGAGLLGILFVQWCVVEGLERTTAFHTALLMAVMPLCTLILGLLTKTERFGWQKLAGILIAFAGVSSLILVNGQDGRMPPEFLLGDFFILLNVIGFALFLVVSKPLLARYNVFSFITWGYVSSAVVLAVLVAAIGGLGAFEAGWQMARGLDDGNLWRLAYVIVLASIGTYLLNHYALSRISPARVAVYVYMQPILSGILGVVMLGEPFGWAMAIASAVTLTGIAMANQARAADAPGKTIETTISPLAQLEEEVAAKNDEAGEKPLEAHA